MSESLTPEAILTDFSRGKVNINLAVDLLLSLIEKSSNLELREACINALRKLGIPKENMEKVYKIIENLLLSDENQFVRNSAAVLISDHLLKYGEDALTWTIQHDSSPLVINTLIELFLDESQKVSLELSQELHKWLSNYANCIGINLQESFFFLEVECLFTKYIKNYEISDKSFTYFRYISNSKSSEPFIFINNRHIERLHFNFYNWLYLKKNQDIIESFRKIKDLASYLSLQKNYDLKFRDSIDLPSSIACLNQLKVLNLSANGIKIIPNYIFTLINLRELDLSRNKIEEIPSSIVTLNKLKVLNLKNNNLDIIPSDLHEYLASLNKFEY